MEMLHGGLQDRDEMHRRRPSRRTSREDGLKAAPSWHLLVAGLRQPNLLVTNVHRIDKELVQAKQSNFF
jgi:hypothetical protein